VIWALILFHLINTVRYIGVIVLENIHLSAYEITCLRFGLGTSRSIVRIAVKLPVNKQ